MYISRHLSRKLLIKKIWNHISFLRKPNNVENLFIVEKYLKTLENGKILLDSSISPEMYRCDPRYFLKLNWKWIIIEQAIERYYNNFLNENIDIVFSGADLMAFDNTHEQVN